MINYKSSLFTKLLYRKLLVCGKYTADDTTIMQPLKGYTARKANRLLGRSGAFWQHESYDHVVRNASEWQRIITYVFNNPIKAGLMDQWQKWQWSYYRDSDRNENCQTPARKP